MPSEDCFGWKNHHFRGFPQLFSKKYQKWKIYHIFFKKSHFVIFFGYHPNHMWYHLSHWAASLGHTSITQIMWNIHQEHDNISVFFFGIGTVEFTKRLRQWSVILQNVRDELGFVGHFLFVVCNWISLIFVTGQSVLNHWFCLHGFSCLHVFKGTVHEIRH